MCICKEALEILWRLLAMVSMKAKFQLEVISSKVEVGNHSTANSPSQLFKLNILFTHCFIRYWLDLLCRLALCWSLKCIYHGHK